MSHFVVWVEMRWLCAILSLNLLLFAENGVDKPPEPVPFPFIGSLLAPLSTVVPYGHFAILPYSYFTTYTGAFNSQWEKVERDHKFFTINPQLFLFFGITPWADINITPQFFTNRTWHEGSVQFGDLPVGLDFQMLSPTATPYFPGIKFRVQETFPTGKFDDLDPKKLLTDVGGAGTFATAFSLVFYKVFALPRCHWLSMNLSATYTANLPVDVHGFNVYGGGFGTKGKVLPGNIFQAIASFELSLSDHWAFAIDNVYTHIDNTTFCGDLGFDKIGAVAIVGLPSSEQISFAPAIEYAFNANFGIEAGYWFTAWGRNSNTFGSAAIELSYTY